MTDSSLSTAPGKRAVAGAPASRSPFATRRRVLLLVICALLLALAVVANYGPLQSYRGARDRLDKASAGLAALEQQKSDLQAKLGRLTEADYLETLARQELAYARPGEDLYIMTDNAAGDLSPSATTDTSLAGNNSAPTDGVAAGDAGAAASDGTAVGRHQGFFEKLLSGFLDLF